MLNRTLIGRVANEATIKTNLNGIPYAIVEVNTSRSYKNPDGTRGLDTVPVKLYGSQVARFQKQGYPGCKIAVCGTFETNPFEDIATNRSFILKARQVEYLTYGKPAETETKPEDPENQPNEAAELHEV